MANTSNTTPHKPDIRFAISIGLAIGIGMATERVMNDNLAPKIGSVGAFFVSVLATAVVAAVVALITYKVIKPRP